MRFLSSSAAAQRQTAGAACIAGMQSAAGSYSSQAWYAGVVPGARGMHGGAAALPPAALVHVGCWRGWAGAPGFWRCSV